MNKEQLQQQIEDMKNKLVEMEAELNKPETVINYWQPKEGDTVYYVTYSGNINTLYYYNNRCYVNELRYRVFKTKEEAERYAEYVKAEETLRIVIAEANEGWLPDWGGSIANYNVRIYNNKIDYTYYYTSKLLPTFMYIKSESLCNKLIKEYEKEFKTYLSY